MDMNVYTDEKCKLTFKQRKYTLHPLIYSLDSAEATIK
jgi:hypothetical protein